MIETAEGRSAELGEKYRALVEEHLTQPEHTWMKGLSPEGAEKLRRMYEERYGKAGG